MNFILSPPKEINNIAKRLKSKILQQKMYEITKTLPAVIDFTQIEQHMAPEDG